MRYYFLVKDMSNKFNFRLRMVQLAQKTSISEAARVYGTTRRTVRKWVYRYKAEGLEGLRDRSRAPHVIPHKMPGQAEERIRELRERHRRWGARRLKERYGLTGSYSAIHRVIKQAGLVKRKKKRWRKRKDLRELKKKMVPFEKGQVDTKDLSDILMYWPMMKELGLPRFEYTYRDMATGATFYAYADRNNSTHARLFASYVIEHLSRYNVEVSSVIWQTDNGSEYIGSVNKREEGTSAFEMELSRAGITHERIPPRCPHWQGDVESFHRIVEDELYDTEEYSCSDHFLGKAWAYQIYFNYFRKNRWRDNKAPAEIVREKDPRSDPGVLNLPPTRLEILLDNYYPTGYHLPAPARIPSKSI